MSLVDANVVLRYLLDDHAELSAKAVESMNHLGSVAAIQPNDRSHAPRVGTHLWALRCPISLY